MSAPPNGALFYEARAKPLSSIGQQQPGAYYQFYLTGTTTPTNVYADGLLTVPLSQTPGTGQTTAASDGRLIAIYMDPATTYRYQLYSSSGVLLDDIDPYIPAPAPTQSQIGFVLYPTTAAETAAGVTPLNFQWPEGYVLRYGNNTTPGTTDMTSAINQAISVVNAGAGRIVFNLKQLYLSGALNTITANDVFVVFLDNSTLQASNTAFATANTTLLTVSGTGTRFIDTNIDGNQAAYSSVPTNACLLNPGNGARGTRVTLQNSPGNAVQTTLGATFGKWTDCNFNNNAGLGWNFWGCSYMQFVNCRFNFNGYGFHNTLATNGFVAFGFAIRYRSHHLTFTACEALQNGRDGMNVNQGSYAIKFIGCTAWMNGDGGFTLANDNTSTGNPGEGESPYDCEYTDCESYNNWSSGWAAYCPVYNMTIDGGRYYNNNRLAGTQAGASSFTNGIYVAAGSLGINIKTKAYDDRQFIAVTAQSGGVVTAPGWVVTSTGSFSPYPRVALYSPAVSGPGFTFQGYGNITTESAGSVTITSAAFSGVTLASIVSGWYISQRVQHNGAFFDNGCTGTADIDGFGQVPGPQPYMGFKTVSGWFSSGQNILLPAAPLDYNELITNPTWDSALTGWTYNIPGGGADNLFTTAGPLLRSVGCLQLIGGSSAATAQATLITGSANYVNNGAWVEASCWVYATLPNQASFAVVWGSGSLNSGVVHPGGGWRQLRIGAYIGSGNGASLGVSCTSVAGATCYFDTASLRVKNETYDNRDFSYPTRNLPV